MTSTATTTSAFDTTIPSTTITTTTICCDIDKECPIKYVTVYNDRAEITRSYNKQFDLEGTYELILSGFSIHVDQNSFHVKGGTGKATILEKVHDLDNDIAQHRQELERINKNINWLDGRANHLMNNTEKNDNSLQQIEQFLDFYYQKLKTLDESKMIEEYELKSLSDQRESFIKDLNTYGTTLSSTVGSEHREVTILLNVQDKKCLVNIEISYLILNCSWKASYDVRVSSETTPSLSGTPPKLSTLKVDYREPFYRLPSKDYNHMNKLERSELYATMKSISPTRAKRSESALTANDLVEYGNGNDVEILVSKAEMSLSSTSFSILRSATIECDGKPHKVSIGVLQLESKFTYTIVLKLSPYAYLKATTTNTSDKQLLSGPINVFMDNNFIAHSRIENVSADEKFDLYLGVDSNVKCEYKPVRKVNETQGLISKVNHEYVKHETQIKNLKTTDICVFIYDHLPLSSDEKIKVKLILPQDIGKLKEHSTTSVSSIINDDNNVEWKVLLKAKEECKLPLEYFIEWPKDKQLDYNH
ncbi:unnamed protein product [Didymodactylos carnosus]|uniref:DUF4139 domain-containing protein n=1 Tax=Didymodactylos carnosus TaxID=1234261 RepID=A0A814XRR3_9BILA|nr:unnamed protein product [Didymodactylos carnosus]CAF1219609.1 unnamed protein product [Didymodactylos carnosus]CAF3983114.1 unnamed protein product [Didymodactylos carnosus]CAF3983261.1 unnamed protein product [Didymodactylos carnosus]